MRGLQKEIDDDQNAAAILQPLKDRAERILKDLENRNTTGLAAMDMLKAANISAMELAREVEALTLRFPNAAVNDDEQRRLRASLYRPLLTLGNEDRTRLVDLIVATLFNQ